MNTILLYESDPHLGLEIQNVLRGRYQVTVERCFAAACAALAAPLHIVLLNLNIEANSGLQLLQHIRQANLLTTAIALLENRLPGLVEAASRLGCRAYLDKGPNFRVNLERLLEQLHHHFARAMAPAGEGSVAMLEVLMHLEEKAVSAGLSYPAGALEFGRTELQGRTLQRMDAFVRKAEEMNDKIKRHWNAHDNRTLHALGKEVTAETFTLANALYKHWKNQGGDRDDELCLVFGGEIELIGLPLELLVDPNIVRGHPNYLARKHPLVRRVAGYRPQGPGLMVESLWGREPLNVLLIAADTSGKITLPSGEEFRLDPIPAVEDEIAALDSYFGELRGHLIGRVRTLAGPQATLQNLKDAFEEDITWHLVHFAGHGVNSLTEPDHSALVLRPPAGWTTPDLLHAHELHGLLQSRPPRLMYLNACEVMQIAPVTASHIEYHGILGAVLRAGVPHVLGFRWLLEDDKAPEFALTFYRLLFEEQLPVAWALLRARQEMWNKYYRRSPIWAAPVLVAQTLVGVR